jgi:repressor LexA
MSQRAQLSKRVQSIYDFIVEYSDAHGYPPSVREIGAAVGLKSPSTVHLHLRTLEEAGYIVRDPNKPRTIELVDRASHARSIPDESIELGGNEKITAVIEDIKSNTITLPLVGRVAAGVPILAEQNVEESIPLPLSLVGDSSSFILKVQGDSMINAGIFNGDYIIVRESSSAHNGQIVVALIDDSATVKTFYRERDRVRLQPENDAMQPIYADDPTILGIVTALIRTM